MTKTPDNYQALLVLSFGGPECRDDVMPFLENVLRGKEVPKARMLEVAEHYYQFGGVSPINYQNRQLITALEGELKQHGIEIPIYFGNRNWHPMLKDTLQQMKYDGIHSALAFLTSAFSCYSGCRQYRENLFEARAAVGEGAPQVHKLRMCFNHPLFIDAASGRVSDAMAGFYSSRETPERVIFTAHSIPKSMADGCDYERQLLETCRLVAAKASVEDWKLVFQSRSGPPSQPWLEPDICDYLEDLGSEGVSRIVIMPIGFLSDHLEVLFDLDTEASEKCETLGIRMIRGQTIGDHPLFVAMIRELVQERMIDSERRSVGCLAISHDFCPPDCCPSGRAGATSPV